MSNNIDIKGLTDALASKAGALGHFESVNTHELKAIVGKGFRAAVWFHEMKPARSSGLASTSAVVAFRFRIYGAMLTEPQDEIDPDMLNAASAYIGSLSGAFTLGGLCRAVDLKGMEGGQGVRARSGYITVAQSLQRIIDIDVPLIVNDVWDQAG
jgi:hypothetical protein